MRLLLLTSAALKANTGPQARLNYELASLMKLHQITIISLGKDPDDLETQRKYPQIAFQHYPIQYQGWTVNNIDHIIQHIDSEVAAQFYDLVVLQMEIWDLMRELGKCLKGKVPFATILHAMPFLGAPVEPSAEFEKDVIAYTHSGIEEYRKNYILKHYTEAQEVFDNTAIIVNNDTVAYYMRLYFPAVNVYLQAKSLNSDPCLQFNPAPRFDFAFMARMEKGKGVEYLAAILKDTAVLLQRKVTLAIAGRTDDDFSKRILEELLHSNKNSAFAEITFYGWADPEVKHRVLSNAKIFIYPSYYDNYPTVLTEALSHGLPCIVWDTVYSKLNYDNSTAVIKAPLGDIEAFAEASTHALENRKELFLKVADFIHGFDSAASIAEKDTILFRTIITRYAKT